MEEKRKPRRKKKPNKIQRDKVRTERADLYNEAFSHGYRIGYDQAIKDSHTLGIG